MTTDSFRMPFNQHIRSFTQLMPQLLKVVSTSLLIVTWATFLSPAPQNMQLSLLLAAFPWVMQMYVVLSLLHSGD